MMLRRWTMSAVRKPYDSGNLHLPTIQRDETPVTFTTEPTYLELPGYTAEISKPFESEDDQLEHERLEVVVTDAQKQDYYADFVTLQYLRGIMESCEGTTEFAGGLYFPGQHRIIVRDLSLSTIKSTLEDLIESRTLPFFFEKVT